MKTLILSLLLCSILFAQARKIPYHYKILNNTLSDFNKDISKSNNDFEVLSIIINEKGAPFLRLFF